MLSIQYKKTIAGYSIKKSVREERVLLSESRQEEDPITDVSQDKYIERILIKTRTAHMFKKFYAEKLGELKYE
jgi:hypothetical protein